MRFQKSLLSNLYKTRFVSFQNRRLVVSQQTSRLSCKELPWSSNRTKTLCVLCAVARAVIKLPFPAFPSACRIAARICACLRTKTCQIIKCFQVRPRTMPSIAPRLTPSCRARATIAPRVFGVERICSTSALDSFARPFCSPFAWRFLTLRS